MWRKSLGVVALPSIMCPLPDAVDHNGARAAFAQAKKDYPGLTPAAHRREAARIMGVDYNTFLAAWKKPKAGAATEPITAVSTPTTATSIRKIAAPRPAQTGLKIDKAAGENPSRGWKVMRDGEHIGYVRRAEITEHHIVPGTRYASGKSVRKRWKVKDAKGNDIPGEFKTQGDALKHLDRKVPRTTSPKPPPVKRAPASPPPTPAANTGLSHTSARAAYNEAKKLNPNGTPAVWRKEAAQSMGIDYKTYLKHWKKPGPGDALPATEPPKTPPLSKMPKGGPDEVRIQKQIDTLMEHARRGDRALQVRVGPQWERKLEDIFRVMAKNNPRAFLRIRRFKWEGDAGTNGSFNMASWEITMNHRLLTVEGRNAASRAQASRWHVPRKNTHTHTEAGHGTMTHEMGHVIHSMLSHDQEVELYNRIAGIIGVDPPVALYTGRNLTVVTARMQEYRAGLELDYWFNNTFLKEIDPWDFGVDHLSQYGTANRMEILAEIYAEYKTQGDKARQLAREVGKMMEDFIA